MKGVWVCSKCGRKWTWEQVKELFYDWYHCPDEECGELVYEELDESFKNNEEAASAS